jgi:hypothetical protein
MIRRNITLIILGVIILLLSLGNLFQASILRTKNLELEELRSRPSSSSLDAPFVNAALSEWAKKNRTSAKRAMDGRYARVIRLGKNVCVSLHIETGGVGGVPVYCFDSATHALTLKDDNVE